MRQLWICAPRTQVPRHDSAVRLSGRAVLQRKWASAGLPLSHCPLRSRAVYVHVLSALYYECVVPALTPRRMMAWFRRPRRRSSMSSA
jgi:hypothetical protein